MVTEPTDLDLLAQWRAGDAEAGQALFERHFDRIYGFFETKCPADADELVQATFLACLRAKDQFRGDSSFRTYLFTIARNELYRVLRTRLRQGTQVDFALSSIAELVSTPGTRMARNQEHRHLLEALRRLPVDRDAPIELRIERPPHDAHPAGADHLEQVIAAELDLLLLREQLVGDPRAGHRPNQPIGRRPLDERRRIGWRGALLGEPGALLAVGRLTVGHPRPG